MCIICNMGSDFDKIHKADEFLLAFEQSRQTMKRAADAMLVCSKIAITADDRKRYDSVHKKMVRKIRAWNKLEEKREHISGPPHDQDSNS